MIDTIYSDPDFLAHHGVKGMKWGVRREKDQNRFRKKKKHLYVERTASGDFKVAKGKKLAAQILSTVGVTSAGVALSASKNPKIAVGGIIVTSLGLPAIMASSLDWKYGNKKG